MAGPFCGMQLADLGADVVKIEDPRGGDLSRRLEPIVDGESGNFVRLNRGKRSVALDLKQVRAFAGAGGTLGQVMKSPLDQTPGAAAARIHDLAGNAREWTADAWHDDAPGPDEPWAAGFRAVRGLPLRQPRPKPLPVELAAYREPMCAVGCPASAAKARGDVGFRCVRPAR